MMVTTAGLGFRKRGSSSAGIYSVGSAGASASIRVMPNSSARISMVSRSRFWLMVAMTPSIMSALMISLTSRPKSSASSLTVTLGGSSTSVGYAATFFSFVCFFFLLWFKERAMREPPSFSLRLLSQSFFVFFLAGFSALLVTGFCAVSSTGAGAAAAGRCGRAGRSVFGRSPFLSFLKRSFLPLPPLCPFLAPCGRSPLRLKRSFL